MNALLVFIGGGLGSLLRYGLGMSFQSLASPFPWATLCANCIAAVLIGVLHAQGVKFSSAPVWFFAAVGFCGGLSTFSTFSLETIQLLKLGQFQWAVINVLVSVALSLGLVFLTMKWLGGE
jgi:CrcB protein